LLKEIHGHDNGCALQIDALEQLFEVALLCLVLQSIAKSSELFVDLRLGHLAATQLSQRSPSFLDAIFGQQPTGRLVSQSVLRTNIEFGHLGYYLWNEEDHSHDDDRDDEEKTNGDLPCLVSPQLAGSLADRVDNERAKL